MQSDLDKLFDKVEDKKSFIFFLKQLAVDSEINSNEWENCSISSYLESISAWIEDFSKCPMNNIDWEKIDYKILAQIFYIGKIYE